MWAAHPWGRETPEATRSSVCLCFSAGGGAPGPLSTKPRGGGRDRGHVLTCCLPVSPQESSDSTHTTIEDEDTKGTMRAPGGGRQGVGQQWAGSLVGACDRDASTGADHAQSCSPTGLRPDLRGSRRPATSAPSPAHSGAPLPQGNELVSEFVQFLFLKFLKLVTLPDWQLMNGQAARGGISAASLWEGRAQRALSAL